MLFFQFCSRFPRQDTRQWLLSAELGRIVESDTAAIEQEINENLYSRIGYDTPDERLKKLVG